MSTYEKTINRMRKRIHVYQNKTNVQKIQLMKINNFINELRDQGRVSKDEIKLYFKKK